MPTGIMSAGGRVCAAMPGLDARIGEGVDNSRTAEEFVGEVEVVFVIGDGIDEEDAKERIKILSMESRGLTGFLDGEGEEGKARGTPAWEQNCWAVFIVANGGKEH